MLFGIQFLICNLYITCFIFFLMIVKRILRNHISPRTQYNLWFLLFGLLIIPFSPVNTSNNFSVLHFFHNTSSPGNTPATQVLSQDHSSQLLNKVTDFSISIGRHAPSFLSTALFIIWIAGMLLMVALLIHSWKRLHNLKESALPLQSHKVRMLFSKCKAEMNVKKDISLYSTAFIKSPIIMGLWKPQIYVPIHLISDFNPVEMRYMFLHELQHYKRKDILAGYFMTLASIIYWFNPSVWLALKEMRCERELACDASVLQILDQTDYSNYGNTLINFAEKTSLSPFPFSAGIGGCYKQLKRRILSISKFHKRSFKDKAKDLSIYLLITCILLSVAPVLSTYASSSDHYSFQENENAISYIDLSSDFGQYKGSFVLYNSRQNHWMIYNKASASKRISPNSTYKIYDALLGLESGIISPNASAQTWNGEKYSYEVWEKDQDLNSAIQNSVNWYFQNIDAAAGRQKIKHFLHEIQYGNQQVGDNVSLYWTDDSLKISPIEQVLQLKKFYQNAFAFSSENIKAVKKALLISRSSNYSLSGKTGTGRINNQDINGWFIGYIERSGQIYYFATNIQNTSHATGLKAKELTISVLNKLHIIN